ncbi:MAG TPA: hypothetical protein VFL57_18500 [Bryobacteraceae bacterium]|nr:hypothetical protein [Bryobacteraceae bacterium]
MNQDLLLWVMTVFVIISAVALCVQLGLLFGIYRTAKSLQEQTATVMPQARKILAIAEATLDESRKHIVDISARASEISARASELMDSAKGQLAKIDALVTDATARARTQLDRAELVVEDTVTRVHEAVAAVHHGVLAPLRQINGLAAGLRTAVTVFLTGGRPNVAEATHQDEMFI